MKFSCEKDILQNAIATASRAAAAKSPINTLEGLLIEAEQKVKITGYDLKKGIYTRIDAAVSEPGSIVLGARIIGDIVRSLPDGIVTISTSSGYKTTIICGNAEFNIIGADSADYPELPDVDFMSNISLKQKTLKKMIAETVFAVSDNESRPVYTGSLFEVRDDELTIVSVDGFRLAMRREEIDRSDKQEESFIVPGAALSEIERICSDSDEMVRITLGSKHISFSVDETVLISRRLEGEFMNYRKTVPQEFAISVSVKRADILSVVDRVSLIIEDKTKNPIRCLFGEDEIVLNCVTGVGKAEDVCPADGTGGGLEIGFNHRYLREALRAAPSDKLVIQLNSGLAPCVIAPDDEEKTGSFVYMVLPVRLKADEY